MRLLPSETLGNHYQGDAMDIIGDGWDLMVAHPPCTYLCNSGVRWLHTEPGRWDAMRKGAEFFKGLLNAPIPMIAVENPIPHKYALDIIGARYAQIIQPHHFGHGETKATCLWLKNLPPLMATDIVTGREHRIHRLPPGPNRWAERSKTFSGIAAAFADQWGRISEGARV